MKKLSDIIKTEHIIKVAPTEQLSSALAKLSTSHDAAFVFNDKKEFVGLINPYYCLIHSSLPGNAKLEKCIYHPPKINLNDSLNRVIKQLIESKIHYLPVFDSNQKLKGIVSSRHLMAEFRDDTRFNILIEEILEKKKKQLITVFEDDPISAAIHLFKKEKLSKLVVIGRDFKLKGILSYYDLIHFLTEPKEKQKAAKESPKTSFLSQKIKKFSKTFVLTLSKEDSMNKALGMLLDKKIGSIVITNRERQPIGIVTTRDFMVLLMQEPRPIPLELVQKNLSETSRTIVRNFITHLDRIVKKSPGVRRAKLLVKEEKKGTLFEVAFSLFTLKGKPKVIKEEGDNLSAVLTTIKKHNRKK